MDSNLKVDLTNLQDQKCVPCQVGAPILEGERLHNFFNQVEGWELYDNEKKLKKVFVFENFAAAIEFINKVAKIAEEAGHHPDICLFDYKNVRLEIWTHKINGLHKNDFILASRVDMLLK